MADSMNFTDVLDHLDDKADGEKFTLGEIMDSLGSRGYGPILLAFALIEILPTGAIPGVPTILAILIILIAAQLVLGKSTPWVPHRLKSKGFDRKKFEHARKKVRPFTQKMDKLVKPRLKVFITPFAARVAGGICILLAMSMPPLEVVPFASSIPSAAIGFLGIGLSARDGLIILLGYVVAASAGVAAVYWLVL